MAKHEFGIMMNTPRQSERYDEYEPWKYECISVDDKDLEGVVERLSSIDFYWHTLSVKGNLKMKQKDKITGWVYEEYKKYVTEHEKAPDSLADEQIVRAVLDKINEAQIWIPGGEIYDYYRRKKPQLQKRLDNEKLIEFKSYVSFYKSIVDQDRASVVICNLKHEIIYMNPAAVTSYAKRGGDKLIGRSLLDCHNSKSRDRIQQVVDWFAADESHNIVYAFHNEKQNKDVYMVALRDKGKLIGYYEKHEYRNSETMKPYDLW